MNNIEEVVLRLQEHSGLAVPTPQVAGESFAEKVLIGRQGGEWPDFESAVQDIIKCFEQLNQLRKSSPEECNKLIPLPLAYAVSGIQLMSSEWAISLLPSNDKTKGLLHKVLRASWMVGCAWDALLAGDIEDLDEHIRIESGARNLD